MYGVVKNVKKETVDVEFAWAQWKGEEIQEGYLVSGILIPLIIPVTTPL